MTLSRRDLLRWLRPPAATIDEPAPKAEVAVAAPAGFSLDGFYRDRSAPTALPRFAVHAAAAPTTAVGQGPGRATPGPSASADSTAVPTGLVPEVIESACLAARSFCSVCVERCPRPGAIVVTAGRPRIVEDRCDGCGRCIAVCPAPALALALVPRQAPGGAP